MTIHSERVNAILNTEAFLYQLLDPKKTPKVPLSIRKRAGELLKHYPTEFYVRMEEASIIHDGGGYSESTKEKYEEAADVRMRMRSTYYGNDV